MIGAAWWELALVVLGILIGAALAELGLLALAAMLYRLNHRIRALEERRRRK